MKETRQSDGNSKILHCLVIIIIWLFCAFSESFVNIKNVSMILKLIVSEMYFTPKLTHPNKYILNDPALIGDLISLFEMREVLVEVTCCKLVNNRISCINRIGNISFQRRFA